MNQAVYSLLEKIEFVANAMFMIAAKIERPNRRRSSSQSPEILISRIDGIGDLVLFTAALKDYRTVFADSRITLLVSVGAIDLVKSCPYVDEVWVIDTRKFRFHLLEKIQWFRRVRNPGFDVAIYAPYSQNFSYMEPLIGWTGASARIAHECSEGAKGSRNLFPFFTELVPIRGEWKHELERNEDMLRWLGYKGESNRRTEIWLDSGDGLALDDLERPYAVVVPGARISLRAWQVEKFCEVITKVSIERELTWLVLGGAVEKETCRVLSRELSARGIRNRDLSWTTLPDAARLLNGAVLCFGNDTGLMHIANAMGTPTVTVIGGGLFGMFLPYPNHVPQRTVYNQLDCFRCRENCIYDSPLCITEITVDKVYGAVSEILSHHPIAHEVC